MAVLNPNKTIDKEIIKCGETGNVTISFDSKSELINKPSDIVLVIDNSSSMFGERIAFAKKGINNLIEFVVNASGGTPNKTIGNGSRIALATFSSTATEEIALTDDVVAIKNKVNTISTGGRTNHDAAFELARTMIDKQSSNDQIVILFTDGITTEGPNPDSSAEALKIDGAEIYCIGLVNDDTNLQKWASDPKSTHVASTNDVGKLEELFTKISYEVIKSGAEDVVINEKVNDNFKITKVNNPTHGIATLKSPQTIEWKMDAVGLTENDKVELKFEIEYIGKENATINVNDILNYQDRDNNELVFPKPTVNVECNTQVIIPDTCKVATSFQMEGCNDAKTIVINDAVIQDLGRIVQVDVPIKNVCPSKRVALGVILTEIDGDGIEHARGMKTVLINPIVSDKCENILIKCVNFVVPEALDVTGNVDAMCNDRDFKVRALVNYIDTNFVCCDPETVIVE